MADSSSNRPASHKKMIYGETLWDDCEKVFNMEEQLLPINKWVTLTVELKKGELFIQIDNKSKHFKHDLIDMGTHRQIDFRGINDGGIRLDWVKVYKGNRNK